MTGESYFFQACLYSDNSQQWLSTHFQSCLQVGHFLELMLIIFTHFMLLIRTTNCNWWTLNLWENSKCIHVCLKMEEISFFSRPELTCFNCVHHSRVLCCIIQQVGTSVPTLSVNRTDKLKAGFCSGLMSPISTKLPYTCKSFHNLKNIILLKLFSLKKQFVYNLPIVSNLRSMSIPVMAA